MATNSYSAGNLEMQIQAVGSDATASLSSVNSQLQTMVSLIGANVSHFREINTTARSMSRMTFNWTKKLADGLNSITTVDTRAFYNKMQSLTRIMQPFVDQLNQAQVSLVALQKVLNSTRGKRDIVLPNVVDGENRPDTPKPGKNKTLSFAKILGKLYFIRNYTKQIGRGVANMLQNAIDYTETLNLWQVAMRNNRYEAEQFVETMNKAYGISEQTLMNYQATFKNMLSALGGISEGTSYALSEYLTQMALDYASLYNTSIERAMTVFQSVLSGQVRPIRSISGYDITETTIYQLYQQLGGTKTMRQLTQTEKRLLRIYAVFQQMENSGTIGDLNKTLGNSANQLRILSEGLKELGTWFGVLMEMWLKPILPYLNAFVITMKNIIKAIAFASGYTPFEGAIESVEEYNEALDETTGKLLSFDRFEALNAKDNDGGMLGIDESLLAGLSRYESILDGVTSQATELAEKWTKWWVDDEGNLTEQAQNLLNVLKDIGSVLAIIIGYNLITKVFKLLTGFKSIKSALLGINKAIAVYMAFDLITNWDEMTDGMKLLKTAILGVTVALWAATAAHMSWLGAATMGVAAAVLVGVLGTVASAVSSAKDNSLKDINAYKTGGLVEDGIFTMNKKEIIGKFDDGSTVVANDLQIISGIENASYRGQVRAMREVGYGGGVGDVYLDGRKVGVATAKASHEEMKRTGLIKANK